MPRLPPLRAQVLPDDRRRTTCVPGRSNTEFRGYPFIGDDSLKAQRFVLAAGLQDRLWNLQEALYRNQGAENSGWVTDDLIRRARRPRSRGSTSTSCSSTRRATRSPRRSTQGIAQAEADDVPGHADASSSAIGSEEPYMIQSGLTAEQLRAALDDALGG